MKLKPHIELIYALLGTILIGIVGWNTGLFWDNVLFVHKMSIPLIENGIFAWGSFPLQVDSGHPPFIATYMTFVWSIFGRSIHVAHIVLYPFVLLFIWELLQISQALFKSKKFGLIATTIILADPTVFSSLMYVGIEVFVLSFSALAIRGIIYNDAWRKTIGLMLLGVSSLRGMLLCAGLFLWDLAVKLFVKRYTIKQLCSWKSILPYIIASIPAVTFVFWRLLYKGWIISNPISPWGNATGFESITDFLINFARNIVVFVQRITDFGRVIIWGIVISLLYINRAKIKSNDKIIKILLFVLFSCSPIVIISLLIKNPMGHSYFLLIYIGLIFLFVELVKNLKWHKIVYTLAIGVLLLGNLIVYPPHISQGWAASLASLPYWQMRNEVLSYIDTHQIPREKVLFYFPFGTCADDIELNNDTRAYAKDINSALYFVDSNVCNFDDATLKNIKQYTPIFHTEKKGVYITLYKLK